MPGVPSSRGCDACRRQKKKCIFSTPPCMRCIRLSIPCTGSGQRFKFQTPVVSSQQVSMLASGRPTTPDVVPRNRSSQSLLVAQSLISQLEVVDIRYDISVYGLLLRDVPSRIGCNEALDAATLAFTEVHSCLHVPECSHSALKSYGRAIEALRWCLDDSSKARAAETLCAVWLIWICEGWFTIHDDWSKGHGEGAAYLLNRMDFGRYTSEFDVSLLLALCTPILIEAMFNPRIKLQPWLPKILNRYCPQSQENADLLRLVNEAAYTELPSTYSLSLPNLAKLPLFSRDPLHHRDEMRELYELIRAEHHRLNVWLAKAADIGWPPQPTDISSPSPSRKLFHRFRSAKAVLLCLALPLNSILQEFDLLGETLQVDSTDFCHEVILLVEQSQKLRPLGARHATLVLMSVWANTAHKSVKEHAMRIMAERFSHEALMKWTEGCCWLRNAIQEVCFVVRKSQQDLKNLSAAPF